MLMKPCISFIYFGSKINYAPETPSPPDPQLQVSQDRARGSCFRNGPFHFGATVGAIRWKSHGGMWERARLL